MLTETIHGYQIRFFNYEVFWVLYKEIFAKGVYFFSSNRQGQIKIIDGGANIGMSVLYFKVLHPNSHIQAFEPDPTTFKLLQYNIEQNQLTDVELINKAVSAEDGEISFFVNQDETGSLLMSENKERLPDDAKVAEIKVPSVALSKVIMDQKIDVLKLDIEGGEDAVMRELARAGKLSQIDIILVEYHHKISPDDPSRLGKFLQIFEDNSYDYQVDTQVLPIFSKNKFQDVRIVAYSK